VDLRPYLVPGVRGRLEVQGGTACGEGVFEVVVDGRLLYSKKQTGQHADLDALAAEIGKL
jgi:hypothetical protein